MFYPVNDDEETTSSSRGITMKKRTFLLSTLIGIILFACGGGGGGGSGTNDGGAKTIYSPDYLSNDMSKTYTFTETEVDTLGGQQSPQTSTTMIYSYAQTPTIPPEYGYFGTIAGPYLMQTLKTDGTTTRISYLSSSGNDIIIDDLVTYTSSEPVHTTLTGNIPSDWTAGEEYSQSSIEDLLNSVPNQGTFGARVGVRKIDYAIKALGVENVTVTAGIFEALKTLETSTIIITSNDGTQKTIESSSNVWYGKGVGLVKRVGTVTSVYTDGTVTSTIADELTSLSP
jgi:hypothetical protein